MSSLRSRFFVFMINHRHWFKFEKKRRVRVDKMDEVEKLRREVEQGAERFAKLPKGFEIEAVQIGERCNEWLLPPHKQKDKVLLYFHGGGLVMGSAKSHRGIVSKFVKGSDVSALVVDYRLAPEHPFPAALNDVVTVYKYLLEQDIQAKNIVIGGDSGGGNLCLAILLALKEQKLPQPAGAFALSPWVDLKNEGESYISNAERDNMTWKDAQEVFSDYYCAGKDPGDPLISPLYGDLSGLPPLSLYSGGDELLRDDAVRFAEKAKSAGVDVTLTVGEGMFHCYPVCAPIFPEATTAMAEICTFIRRQLNI